MPIVKLELDDDIIRLAQGLAWEKKMTLSQLFVHLVTSTPHVEGLTEESRLGLLTREQSGSIEPTRDEDYRLLLQDELARKRGFMNET